MLVQNAKETEALSLKEKEEASRNTYLAKQTSFDSLQAKDIARLAKDMLQRLRDAEEQSEFFRKSFVWRYPNSGMACFEVSARAGYAVQKFRLNMENSENAIPMIEYTGAYRGRKKAIEVKSAECSVEECIDECANIVLWKERFVLEEDTQVREYVYYTIQIREKDGPFSILRCVSSDKKTAELVAAALQEAEASYIDADALFEDLRLLLGEACFAGEAVLQLR